MRAPAATGTPKRAHSSPLPGPLRSRPNVLGGVEARGRKIQPVNEQRIRLSMGRDGFTGITSCSATAPVDFAE